MFTRLWRDYTCASRNNGRDCDKANIRVNLDRPMAVHASISIFNSWFRLRRVRITNAELTIAIRIAREIAN